MNTRTLVALGVVLVLSACATYTFDGNKYSNAEQFQSAVDTTYAQTRQQLVAELRVPAPIAKKTLTVGIPTAEALKRSLRMTNPNSPLAQPMQDNLGLAMRKEDMMFAEVVKDIGIYQDVKIVDTTGGHLQPMSTESVLYFYVVDGAGGQWYINGGKAGMQTVNVDRGQPQLLGKAKSLINSVKGYALTDTAVAATVVGPAPTPTPAAAPAPTPTPVAASAPLVAPSPAPVSAPDASASPSLKTPVRASAEAAPPTAPASNSKYMFSAERLAKAAGCVTPAATMNIRTPVYEAFTVTCSGGEPMSIRCENGNCRELK